jgi:hypothetical protein
MLARHEDDPLHGAELEMAQREVETVHQLFGELCRRVGPL